MNGVLGDTLQAVDALHVLYKKPYTTVALKPRGMLSEVIDLPTSTSYKLWERRGRVT